MAAIELPPGAPNAEALYRALLDRYRIQVPFTEAAGKLCVRVSAHLYNTREDYEQLARALLELLATTN